MNGFDFVSAKDLQDVLTILSKEKDHACLVAGATNVVNKMHIGKIQDKVLVNIDALDELRGIEYKDGYVTIGAMTCMAEVARSEVIKQHARVLYEAAQVFADPITRNRATIGGNICDASPAADTAPALLVLNAEVELASIRGKRTLPISEFFLGVGRTATESDEIVTAVRFLDAPTGAFTKIGLRNSLAISVVSVAAIAKLDSEGKFSDVRIALGSVAPRPVRAPHAEQALLGNTPGEQTYAAAKTAVLEDISPIDDVRATAAYRRGVSGVVMERTVSAAL